MLCTPSAARDLRAILKPCENLKGRIALLLQKLEYATVSDGPTAAAVAGMRYEAYFKQGATSFSSDRLLADRYDDSPNAITGILGFDGLICASIRLHVVTEEWHDSPAVEAFPDHLKPLIRNGHRLVDPNCFCVDPLLSGGVPELAYLTLRLPFMMAELRGRTLVTATVRSEHAAFYRRVLRCHQVAPPKLYAGRTKPLGLMLCDFDSERSAILSRNPFFAPAPGEIERIGLDRIDAMPARREAVAA
jgi:hypothetical protein